MPFLAVLSMCVFDHNSRTSNTSQITPFCISPKIASLNNLELRRASPNS